LIDEARTPLIIAGDGDEDLKLYELANNFVKTVKEEDFEMDRKDKTIALTASGISKAESFFGITNLTDIKNIELYHHINQ
ncbi:preprotein translocase subunit SecA, partial [Clostridioides difficile]|nr:preprotein translocase subunit SecA [Clostridioides difficile]